MERVVEIYSGENRDLDIAFWNIDWFTSRYLERTAHLAAIVADLNLDIWVLTDASARAVASLAERLGSDFGLRFGFSTTAGPEAPAHARTTAVLWNEASVSGGNLPWPGDIGGWFAVDSRQFEDLRCTTVPGPIFDCQPGLYGFSVSNRRDAGLVPFEVRLVSLQVSASGGGRQRRRMAAHIVAAAIAAARQQGHDTDWLIGGDFDADAAMAAFRSRFGGEMAPLAAAAEPEGVVSYLRSARSLTNRIVVSPNLARNVGADDLLVVAAGQYLPDDVTKLPAPAPLLVRLSLSDAVPAAPEPPASLMAALTQAGRAAVT